MLHPSFDNPTIPFKLHWFPKFSQLLHQVCFIVSLLLLSSLMLLSLSLMLMMLMLLMMLLFDDLFQLVHSNPIQIDGYILQVL